MTDDFHEKLVTDLVTEFHNRLAAESCTRGDAMQVLGSVILTIIGSYAGRDQHCPALCNLFEEVHDQLHDLYDDMSEQKDLH